MIVLDHIVHKPLETPYRKSLERFGDTSLDFCDPSLMGDSGWMSLEDRMLRIMLVKMELGFLLERNDTISILTLVGKKNRNDIIGWIPRF